MFNLNLDKSVGESASKNPFVRDAHAVKPA